MNWLSFSTKCLGHLCNDLTEIINDTEANKNAQFGKCYWQTLLEILPMWVGIDKFKFKQVINTVIPDCFILLKQRASCKVEYYLWGDHAWLLWSIHSTILMQKLHWQLPQVYVSSIFFSKQPWQQYSDSKSRSPEIRWWKSTQSLVKLTFGRQTTETTLQRVVPIRK